MIEPDDNKNVLVKTGALIRHTFGVDPYKLTEERFAQLGAEALYIQDFKRQQMEIAFSKTLTALVAIIRQ